MCRRRHDHGGDALQTVQTYIAARANVAPDVVSQRRHIAVDERVNLNVAEYRGVQNLLTHRLKSTLAAQVALI